MTAKKIPVPVFLKNTTRRYVWANDAFCRFSGKKENEIKGKLENHLFQADDQKESRKADQRILSEGVTIEKEEVFTFSNGARRPVILIKSLLNAGDKQFILGMIVDMTAYKKSETDILGRIFETEEKERRRFSADIHDDLGPLISCARLQLGFLERSAGMQDLSEEIEKIYGLLDAMDHKMHAIIRNIDPFAHDNNGLGALVEELCKTIEQNSRITITRRSDIHNFQFSKEVELHLYRIISELLNNTMKHSGATRVMLKMSVDKKKILRISYSDNGNGYDIEKISGHHRGAGMFNILYRVSLIQGEIRFERSVGKTIVKISRHLD